MVRVYVCVCVCVCCSLTFTNNVGHYDERADIYAAGALCNYVLTGKHEWVVKDKKEVNIFAQQDVSTVTHTRTHTYTHTHTYSMIVLTRLLGVLFVELRNCITSCLSFRACDVWHKEKKGEENVCVCVPCSWHRVLVMDV